MFFTCVEKGHKELAPIYEYCVKRVYPNEHVEVFQTRHASCSRFLVSRNEPWVHITDADILVLPHKLTHEEYYSKHKVNDVSYLRGCTESGNKKYDGVNARICGGHFSIWADFYKRTVVQRFNYNCRIAMEREFDEIMLAKILKESGYPIPEKPYTFPDGEEWDKEYRDLHLQDFNSFKYEKWKPDKQAIKDLFAEQAFRKLVSGLESYWKMLLDRVERYANDLPVH